MRTNPFSLFFVVTALGIMRFSAAAAATTPPAPPPIRVVVRAFDNLNEEPSLKRLELRDHLARLVEEDLRALPYIQILPRPKPGFLSRNAEFIVRGDYLTLANGRSRLSARLLGRDGSAVATWSEEAASWRALTSQRHDTDPEEASGRQRSPVRALTARIAQELLRQYTLRQLDALRGSPHAVVASMRLEPRKEAYLNGERVSIIITPEEACHVTALHVRAGNDVRLICPAPDQEDGAARAKREYVVGGRALPIQSIQPWGAEESRVLIFLTREPLVLSPERRNARAPEEQLRLLQALVEALNALPADRWSDREMALRILTPSP